METGGRGAGLRADLASVFVREVVTMREVSDRPRVLSIYLVTLSTAKMSGSGLSAALADTESAVSSPGVDNEQSMEEAILSPEDFCRVCREKVKISRRNRAVMERWW